MIRVTLLLLVVAFLSWYAWPKWFVSLCGAVLLMAVVQHPDFPKSIAGIQGLNPWNLLLLSIVLAWWRLRHQEGLVWDMPRHISWMLIGYCAVAMVGVLRFIPNRPVGFTLGQVISEDVINCIKWVIPGLLFFDACRTRRRVLVVLVVVSMLYILLSVQVIKWMPLSYAVSGSALSTRASKIIQNEIGYNRVTLSMMLGGASWAIFCAVNIGRTRLQRLAVAGAAGVVAFAQALTAGRTGYITWGLVGLILSVVRWRKLLVIIPIVVIAISIALPGVRERLLLGVGGTEGIYIVETSEKQMTSGRNLAWPVVIEKIKQSPLLGYGRKAMVTTGLKDELWDQYRESFPHPHEAYLELLLDNGIVGFLLVIPFYVLAVRRSFQLMLDRSDPLVSAVGGAAFALITALLVGSFGGQTFYPREGAVGMWVAIGLMLRVSVQKQYSLETGSPLFEDDEYDPEIDLVTTPAGEAIRV